jgi:hypothetical protein
VLTGRRLPVGHCASHQPTSAASSTSTVTPIALDMAIGGDLRLALSRRDEAQVQAAAALELAKTDVERRSAQTIVDRVQRGAAPLAVAK